jgi:hypothetical protein
MDWSPSTQLLASELPQAAVVEERRKKHLLSCVLVLALGLVMDRQGGNVRLQ